MESSGPDVSVVVGSKSDLAVAEAATKVLTEYGVPFEVRVLSAHRDFRKLDEYLCACRASVFIAIAGLSAQLPGYIAARIGKPVIGVPVSAKLGGMDALLSIVQMPRGVPVGCVGIDGGENAALLAVRILALSDSGLAERLRSKGLG
jgi:5-(carboxyamino)imidazole ribonucleotide mutase